MPWGSWSYPETQQPQPQAAPQISPEMIATLRRHLGLDDATQSMTHQPEQPNPAAPAVEMGKRIGEHFVNKAASALTAPRDAFTGAMPVTDPETGMPSQEAMERGKAVAGMAMTGGVPFARQGAAGMAGGRLAQPGSPEIILPSSPKVQQAIDRLKAWLPINERNGPAPALRKNIEIMERGGRMAETMAEHTLKTWGAPPTRAIEPPTIEGN